MERCFISLSLTNASHGHTEIFFTHQTQKFKSLIIYSVGEAAEKKGTHIHCCQEGKLVNTTVVNRIMGSLKMSTS